MGPPNNSVCCPALYKLMVLIHCWNQHLLIDQTEVSWCLHGIFMCMFQHVLFVFYFFVQEGTLEATKGETLTSTQSHFQTTSVFWMQDMLGPWWHEVCGSNQTISELTLGSRHKMEPIPTLLWLTRIWDLYISVSKTLFTIFKIHKSNPSVPWRMKKMWYIHKWNVTWPLQLRKSW